MSNIPEEPKPFMDEATFSVFAKLMEASGNETARINTMVITQYQQSSDRRGRALDNISNMLFYLRPEVPRSSEGGWLVEQIYRQINSALFDNKEIPVWNNPHDYQGG